MNIAVNTRFLLKGKLEGIGWFTNETVKRMVANHPNDHFIFLFDRPFDPAFIFGKNVTPVIVSPPARHPILWLIWFEIMVPFYLKKYKADVFLSTDGFCSLRTKVPTCIVIHDLAFLHYPKHLSFLIAKHLKFYTKLFVKKAQKIIAVSTYTKNDIIASYQINPDKVKIIYNGAHDVYQPLEFDDKQSIKQKYANGTDYFVYAGSLHPRKNIVNLLKAFLIFKQKTKSNMKLLLIGRLAWKTKEIEEMLDLHPYKNDIIRYEYMDADKLCEVVAAAYCMVYVSLFEGFGIPILEAMKCNVPVITSNTTSMPEVVGDAGLLVNPENADDIAEKMITIYKDENLRNTLIKNCVAQSSKFDWNTSSEKLYNILTSLKK